jgi:predicted nucleic acid-binding protein
LIALLHADDANHTAALQAAQHLAAQEAEVLFPLTAIIEAITVFQRRLSNPTLSDLLTQQVLSGELLVEDVGQDVLHKAVALFDPFGSKQNTLFDAVVATVARKHNSSGIFSFDNWYTQQGFALIRDV